MSRALIIPDVDFSTNKLDTVTFGTVPCTAISLSDSTKTLTTIGGTATLTASLTPPNTTDTLTWTSSDNTVVSVSNGVITANKVGEATITATCGEQTATCTVAVNVIPNAVVVGAFSPYKTASGTKATTNNTGTTTSEFKYGIIAGNNSDTSVRRVDCYNGVNEGDYRFVPIPVPSGADRIKIESKLYKNTTLLSFQTNFLWFDSTQDSGGASGAKCLAGKGENVYDQDNTATSVTIDIPTDLTGLDSFAVGIKLSDWAIKYNTDYSQYFDITILPPST